MDHEAARDWIDEAFFAPGTRQADDAAAHAVRTHLAACPECTTFDEETRRTALKLDLARGPSPEVRTRLLAAAQRIARTRAAKLGLAPVAEHSWWRTRLTWRFAPLVLVIAIAGAGAGAWWANAVRPDSDADHLAEAVVMMSRLASDSGAHEVVLRDTAGTGQGVAVVSAASHKLALFATHMPGVSGYHCYLERAGQRTWIGSMYIDGGVQFWAGEMDSAIDMEPGDALVVAADVAGPAVLSATL